MELHQPEGLSKKEKDTLELIMKSHLKGIRRKFLFETIEGISAILMYCLNAYWLCLAVNSGKYGQAAAYFMFAMMFYKKI